MDNLEQAPEVINTAPAEPLIDATAAPVEEGSEKPEATPEEKRFTQDELNRFLAKEKAKIERRAEREAGSRAELMARAMAAERLLQQQQPQKRENEPPSIGDFNSYEDFTRALIKFETAQNSQQFAQTQAQTFREAQAYQVERERFEAAKPSCEKAMAKYEDWGEVATTFSMPPAMEDAVLESSQTGEVAYYLGSNPNELARISRLSPVQQVREIVKLEDRFSKPTARTTNAPSPMTPISGGSSSAKSLETMNQADFEKALYGKK